MHDHSVVNMRAIQPHILLTLFLASTTNAIDPGCFQRGECVRSLWVGETDSARSAQACLELCRADDDCNAFNYRLGEYRNVCSLLNNCAEFDEDVEDSVSGGRECPDLTCWTRG